MNGSFNLVLTQLCPHHKEWVLRPSTSEPFVVVGRVARGRLFVKFFAKSSPLIEREREREWGEEGAEGADKQLEE